MSYTSYTVKDPQFYNRWLNNIRLRIAPDRSINIICHSSRELDFCISRLKTKLSYTDVSQIRASHTRIDSHNPVWVRWIFSADMDRIVVDRSSNTFRDESLWFTDIFEVNWISGEQVLIEKSILTASLREESEISIIHSKINYNVIQTES